MKIRDGLGLSWLPIYIYYDKIMIMIIYNEPRKLAMVGPNGLPIVTPSI